MINYQKEIMKLYKKPDDLIISSHVVESILHSHKGAKVVNIRNGIKRLVEKDFLVHGNKRGTYRYHKNAFLVDDTPPTPPPVPLFKKYYKDIVNTYKIRESKYDFFFKIHTKYFLITTAKSYKKIKEKNNQEDNFRFCTGTFSVFVPLIEMNSLNWSCVLLICLLILFDNLGLLKDSAHERLPNHASYLLKSDVIVNKEIIDLFADLATQSGKIRKNNGSKVKKDVVINYINLLIISNYYKLMLLDINEQCKTRSTPTMDFVINVATRIIKENSSTADFITLESHSTVDLGLLIELATTYQNLLNSYATTSATKYYNIKTLFSKLGIAYLLETNKITTRPSRHLYEEQIKYDEDSTYPFVFFRVASMMNNK